MISLPTLDDTLSPDLAMLEPFVPVVAWVLFDAEPTAAQDLRDHLLLAPPSPGDSLFTLLRIADFARRHGGPVVPWSAWEPTFQALAERDWDWDHGALRVLLLASCTPSDPPHASRSPRL